MLKKIPPLFIPRGFFDHNIKIRYGYEKSINEWININPLSEQIDADTDLNCLLEDIPHFGILGYQ